MPHSAMLKSGPGLYEFLIEAELQQYYSTIKNDLKVNNVHQLKYATDEDFLQVGLSRPEVRRLRKIFHKHCPQNYLYKFKNIIKAKKEDGASMAILLPDDGSKDRSYQLKVPSKHIIPAEAIIVNKELGVGEFGIVQQGVWTNEDGDRIQVAIKCLSKERMQNNPMEFLKEAAIMHTIDHEHIVRLYGVVLDTNSLMLVTELAPLRSLLECLKEPALRPSFPVPSLCDFSIQICDGMQYLESKRLIHRDLAARNILVFTKNKIKISDFGLSRALGVGKDYYQTNFNVNLKLPIAWCAPECINYLKFTSASDVWAFGVTLWEMFSYGFQPWAALTGQQILEAIDEPNYQRLEPPESCPKDYYSIMLKCWQHEPHNRPRFIDLMSLLPDCKPEQVQAIQDSLEDVSKPRRDQLQFRIGDVLTVLDKKPMPEVANSWKGVLNNGKTGLFNPAHTVSYLGNILPSIKPQFSRGGTYNGKNAYSSKRRLRTDMISSPQGDLKHTGHVGLDGAYFGDVAFLGDKLPKQVVSPYKPQDDIQNMSSNGNNHGGTDVPLTPSPGPASPMCGPPSAFSINSASSDLSDRAPLLARFGDRGRAGPAADHNWSDTASEKDGNSAPPTPGFLAVANQKALQGINQVPVDAFPGPHEYHEISDEEVTDSPGFDLGPSLMDEVLRALGGGSASHMTHSPYTDRHFDWKEDQSSLPGSQPESKRGTLRDTLRKKQAHVKPISASDQRTLDQAIAMANELATRSMLELDAKSSSAYDAVDHSVSGHMATMSLDSPRTPSSPSKRKFSFKFSGKTSPKHERRNFAQEAASIADLQSILTEESKSAYNILIEKPVADSPVISQHLPAAPTPPSEPEDSNPLRMLRSGGLTVVRPKIRGNKHHSQSSRDSRELKDTMESIAFASLARVDRGKLGPPPVSPKPRLNKPAPLVIENSNFNNFNHYRPPGYEESMAQPSNSWLREQASVKEEEGEDGDNNPLPLPPRDRTRPTVPTKPRHQRKHPLIYPTNLPNPNRWGVSSEGNSNPDSPLSPPLTGNMSLPTTEVNLSSLPPAKPPRAACNLDDSYDSQIASELEALDDMEEETNQSVTSSSSLYQSKDHVSCEDLLDFACDRPNSKRTRGPAQGTDSDEVRIMQKVLGKEKTSPDECLSALDETEWDVHKAIKLIKLCSLLSMTHPHLTSHSRLLKESLNHNCWDVARAAAHLISQAANREDCTRV
ncbi:activated Cdc42 kinase-like isoform X3 [Daphnia pulicaria]|uniref:activated Cdc42 kinase-like isoform X3 n=1 Tax=Daphnia pulicaria TaxID=35523 RepID=UPI001EEA2B6B|nr:activated Cdc42 kinase-like isoform X3 [Daphnia pulicaria]